MTGSADSQPSDTAPQKEMPILPTHVESTVQAIADLHMEHQRRATPVQRAVSRMTSAIGRPRFVGLMTVVVALWAALNFGLPRMGWASFDAPPFAWLQDVVTLLSLYITVLILITQRHDEQLAEHRAQLTLQLAILSEQKSAKIIALLEEMRRDHPHLADREDREAAAMARPADPQKVLDAIRDVQDDALTSAVQSEAR